MPRWLLLLNVLLVIGAAAGLRFGMTMPYGATKDSAILMLYFCLAALVALNGAALLYRYRAAIGNFPPFKLIRLWYQAKEKELQKRAGD